MTEFESEKRIKQNFMKQHRQNKLKRKIKSNPIKAYMMSSRKINRRFTVLYFTPLVCFAEHLFIKNAKLTHSTS